MKLWLLGACDPSFVAALKQATPHWPCAPAALIFRETPDDAASLRVASDRDLLVLLGATAPTAQAAWRTHLANSGWPFQVLYGEAPQALKNLAFAWSSHVRSQSALRPEILPRWEGVCEACSDPECEHRLFSRLLAPPRAQ